MWTKFRSLSAVLLHSVFLEFHCCTKMHAQREIERGEGRRRETDRERDVKGEGERENEHMKPCSINSASCLLCPSPHAMIAAHNLLKDGSDVLCHIW